MNPTTAEREFVTSLAAGQAVQVGVWDRAKLDGLLATHADLEASFTRDQLFEAAKVYGQERALLMDGVRDVSARVTALGRQADGLDDHRTVDFARQGKTVVHTLRAKHPRAHEVSPVEITLTGNGPMAPDLAQAVRRSLGFGPPEEVVLPRGAVESLTVSGPEWLSGEHRDIEVRWQPTDKVPLTETAVEVVFLDGEQVTACYPGTLTHVGRGSVGRSVTVDLTGGSMELMTPEASGALASLRFTFSLEKLEPSAALRLLRIRQRIMAGGAFEVRASAGAVRGRRTATPARGRAPGGGTDVQLHPGPGGGAAPLRAVLPVPGELTPADRVALRMARLLIQGHCAISPFLPRARFTLNGQDSPTLRALLSGEPHAIQGGSPKCAITVAGRHLNLGPARFYHPHVTLDEADGRRALAALETGHGEGCEVTVRPTGGECFRLLLQDAAPRNGWTAVPLKLPSFTEPR